MTRVAGVRPAAVRPPRRAWPRAAGLLLLVGAAAAPAGGPAPAAPPAWRQTLSGWLAGVRTDGGVVVRARDGTPLATTVMRPLFATGPLPTVLMRTPYGRHGIGRGWARRGFAVVVQDQRGRGDSGGRFEPYRHDADDTAATLDWITAQPWSDGRVGTFGCSALGEVQLVAATAAHPAHRAMVAEGAGGGVGLVGGRFSAFGVHEGGVFQLASALGWFVRQGDAGRPRDRPPPDAATLARVLPTLPVAGMDQRAGAVDTGFDAFRATPPGDATWVTRGYLDDRRAVRITTPGLHVNGWYDQGVSETFAAAAWLRARAATDAARLQPVVIGPGLHCDDPGADRGRVGDVPYARAAAGFDGLYARWLDAWLRGDPAEAPRALADLPAYRVFVMNADRWLDSPAWPPPGARPTAWHLDSGGPTGATAAAGGGRLRSAPPAGPPVADALRADPSDPVPTRGGAFCCTGDPSTRQGPVDQADLARRDDVLAYTSDPLPAPMVIAGPITLEVTVDTDGADADLVARLVDVAPDGRQTLVQLGAQRLSRRDAADRVSPVQPGRPVTVRVSMRDIAWRVGAGHRLRLMVAGSDFPRLERQLHVPPADAEAGRWRVAVHRLHRGGGTVARLVLHLLPDDAPGR